MGAQVEKILAEILSGEITAETSATLKTEIADEIEALQQKFATDPWMWKHRKQPVLLEHLLAVQDFILAIRKVDSKYRAARFIAHERQLKELQCQIAELEQRITDVEKLPVAHDAGTWTHGILYQEGAIVSHHGSGWVCREAHFSTGTDIDHSKFRLLCKKGRDGKDLR